MLQSPCYLVDTNYFRQKQVEINNMKDDNVLVNANTNTGTSRELKLSFTIEHMTLLLMVYDGMRQIENNLLQITGNLDNTDPNRL